MLKISPDKRNPTLSINDYIFSIERTQKTIYTRSDFYLEQSVSEPLSPQHPRLLLGVRPEHSLA